MIIGIFMKGMPLNSIAALCNRNNPTGAQYYSARFLLVLLTLLVSVVGAVPSADAEVFSCKYYSGNTIFTDNHPHCATSKNDSTTRNENSITTVNSVAMNTTQRCGKKVKNKHKVDYCTPRREYYKTGNSWTIYLENTLVDSDKAYADKALHKPEQNLNEIIAKLPPKAARQLKKLDIHMMKG